MTSDISTLLEPPINRAAYSDRTAWMMARCSQLAYVQFEDGQPQLDELRKSLSGLRLDLVATMNNQGMQAILATNPRYAVLAFRGTDQDYRKILSDIRIRFYRDRSTGARTSTGFSQAYAQLEKGIADALAKIDGELPLYITGHSLGGALAAIASTRIQPSDRIAACYTFGCPRVGDGEFGDLLWKVPVYRQVHSTDIVPRVPPPFGYRHAGDLRYIRKNRTMVESPNTIITFLSFAFTLSTGIKKVFENHRIAGYADALQEWGIYRLKLDSDAHAAQPAAGASESPVPPPLSRSAGNP
jgi:hypothetical protein